MTVEKVFEILLLDDRTAVYIRDGDFHLLALGRWFESHVMSYSNFEVESFTWQDDNEVYIDVKQQ